MFNDSDIFAGETAGRHGSSTRFQSLSGQVAHHRSAPYRGPTFSKVFRWQAPDPQSPLPNSVEVVGSFTDWCVRALKRDANTNTWQLTLHGIPGNRTHRYMLLVNGEPVQDRNAEGLAMPEGFSEQQYQLMTPRGPRVFLLFAQAK
jgi:1,4-alpha-glucan branching enzyme